MWFYMKHIVKILFVDLCTFYVGLLSGFFNDFCLFNHQFNIGMHES
jgi:hypothetical protein